MLGKTPKRRFIALVAVVIPFFVVTSGATGNEVHEIEDWRSNCAAASLRTSVGLLDVPVELSQLRAQLPANAEGETSMAEVARAAQSLGLHYKAVSLRSDLIEQWPTPMIAHQRPGHYVVFIGLGKG